MAAPFYSQADQDIYASGNKFIPQEQYRLGPYTPPEIMGQNTNAGIAATEVANPYKWPYPEGGGEYDRGISGTQITKRPLGLSPGALSGGLDEAKLPGFKNWAKRTLGDVQNLYSKLPTPTNLLMKGIDKYQDWRAKQEEEEEEKAQIYRDRINQKIINTGIYKEDYIPTGGGGADIIPPGDDGYNRGTFEGPHPDAPTKTPEQGGWHPGVGGGGQPHGTDTSGDFAGKGSGNPFGRAQGGRIGLRPGGIVDAGKQYYGKEDWEIQQINQYGVSYPEFLANQGFPPLHEMDAGMIALASRAWNTWKAGQKAEGGRVGYATRGFVDEDINVEGPGFDENIEMASAEGVPFMWEEFLAAKAVDPDLTYNDFINSIDRSPWDEVSTQGEGIASLV